MEVLRLLNHKNVIACIDFFENEQLIVMVMPLMRSNLRQYIESREKPIAESEIRDIFRMMVAGIDHCHLNGVVHCDIKPENVLVDFGDDMKITQLCIADFGQNM